MVYPWYAGLNSQINSAYSIAGAYYAAREKQFKKVVFNDSVKALKNFAKELTETARAYRPQVLDQVKAALANGTLPSSRDGKYEADIEQLYQAALSNKKALHFVAGIDFEHFLAKHIKLINAQGEQIRGYTAQQVGAVVNESFATTSAKDTRTDVAIGAGAISSKTQMELTIGLDLHDKKLQELSSERKVTNALMRAITDNQVDLSTFGFQAKTYPSLAGQKWMSSQPLATALRQIFDNGKTWSSNYAELYTVYYLSKYIINIVNPVNIGIIYTGGFIFMSEFLKGHRFYMGVTKRPVSSTEVVKASPERGGGYEIYPSVESNHIKMWALTKGADSLTAKTVLHRDGSMTISLASVKK